MLSTRGGWEVTQLPRLYWYSTTPFRWTQLLLDKASSAVEKTADTVLTSLQGPAPSGEMSDGAARRAIENMIETATPYLQPLKDEADNILKSVTTSLSEDPRVSGAIETVKEVERSVERATQEVREIVDEWASRYVHLSISHVRAYVSMYT